MESNIFCWITYETIPSSIRQTWKDTHLRYHCQITGGWRINIRIKRRYSFCCHLCIKQIVHTLTPHTRYIWVRITLDLHLPEMPRSNTTKYMWNHKERHGRFNQRNIWHLHSYICISLGHHTSNHWPHVELMRVTSNPHSMSSPLSTNKDWDFKVKDIRYWSVFIATFKRNYISGQVQL